jgi:glycosyltransferase involved in cell wall biosynthesis
VTDVGSLGDTVREFEAGAVVPPEDAAALAEACSRLLREPMQAATAALQLLSWERSAEAHERLYEQVLAERRIR